MTDTIAQKNRSISGKVVTDFYVSFYRMSENIANILGRQVKSIERPTISFNIYERFIKGIRQQDSGRILFEPISVSFEDDSDSLANNALYKQVFRQTGKHPTSNQLFEDAYFDMNVKVYNNAEVVVENFTMVDCYILSISHSEQIFSDSTENIITATVGFNNVDYDFISLDSSLEVSYIVDEFGNFITDSFGNKLIE